MAANKYTFTKMGHFRFILLVILTTIASSCTNNEKHIHAKGGKAYGGVFRFVVRDKITNLFPASCFDVDACRIVSQIYDPLLKLDVETMKVIPWLATSYSADNNGEKYTISLRQDVLFHEDPCFHSEKDRRLTAQDVKFSLEIACSGLKLNKIGSFLVNKIVGAQEFCINSKKTLPATGIPGIKVLDDYTLEIRFNNPCAEFDKILTYEGLSISSKKAYNYYKQDIVNHPIGSGPFALTSINEKGIKLHRNTDYWLKDEFGNKLPFLQGVEMSYGRDKKEEMALFMKDNIDVLMDVPIDELEKNVLIDFKSIQLGKKRHHNVYSFVGLNADYIGFNHQSKEFSSIDVRRAFNYAIDRDLIIDEYLSGAGKTLEGVVPAEGLLMHPGKVKNYVYDVQKARSLLAKAGYPNGKNFPHLTFYVSSSTWRLKRIYESVVKQLKENLNIQFTIVSCTYEEKLKLIQSGKAKMWRSEWIADYPSIENFLAIFYTSKSKIKFEAINEFHFRNAEFDKVYEEASAEKEIEKREALFTKCNQIVMDEAATIPIMSTDNTILVNVRIHDFKQNTIDAMNLTKTYIKNPRR